MNQIEEVPLCLNGSGIFAGETCYDIYKSIRSAVVVYHVLNCNYYAMCWMNIVVFYEAPLFSGPPCGGSRLLICAHLAGPLFLAGLQICWVCIQ